MKVELRSDKTVDDASCKADTGRTMAEWFKEMDAYGGLAKGRRELGNGLLQDQHKLDPWWATTLNIEYEAARGAKEKDGRAKGYMICATKSIKATPEACYAAFKDATVMVQHDRLQTRADADGMRRAWGESLDRLKAVVEG